MNASVATTQHVTNASGTVAIASSTTSIGVAKVGEKALNDPALIESVNQVVSNADMIALCSVCVLTLSVIYNIYATRKRRALDEEFRDLRQKEYELNLAKFQAESCSN